MSQVGERDDAPDVEEFEDHGEVEQGADGSGANEDGADALGEEPDEGAGDERQDDDAGTDEGQARQPAEVSGKKGNSEFGRLRAKAREAEARAEAAERRIAEAERAAQGRQTAEQQRLEQERVALMSPEEKTEYLLQRQEQGFNARFGQLEQRLADNADRVAFDSLCARNPAFAALRDEAEQKLAELRRNGGSGTREVVATYLIGQRAIQRALGGGKQKQAKQGQQRVQSQTVKAPVTRGDASAQRKVGGSDRQQRAARLENLEI